jgi:hypothetical protein
MHPYLFASHVFKCKSSVNMNRIFQELGTRIDFTSVTKAYESIRRVDNAKLDKVYRDHVKKYMRVY